jgi:hypothetical protein
MQAHYLQSAIKQFLYYKSLGDKSFEQLSEEGLFWRPNEATNSIAVLVQHLWGNMRSRWTNFLTEDGEKEWRQRDLEFEEMIQNKKELLQKWEEGWGLLLTTLHNLQPSDLETIIYIRNQGHTALEAINRQLCHYAYHVGQIVLLAKQQQNQDWESLSIPRGQSGAFNKDKFSKARQRKHFTDEDSTN